ncbi:MAG: FAD:protein FMN transferase [Coraliomargaritaceae bacterium]
MEREDTVLEGKTMGTLYAVQFYSDDSFLSGEIELEVGALLEKMNQLFSNWREDSWVTRYNAISKDEMISLPTDVASVLQLSLELAEQTNAAFDPTVLPLIDLWGFHSDVVVESPPDHSSINQAMKSCGYQLIRVNSEQTRIGKSVDGLGLDFSAVAKGYAVDCISALLELKGVEHYFVDIGGELRVQGLNPSGKNWRIGIARPIYDLSRGGVVTAFSVARGAIATSGNYQNFRQIDGVRYNHIFDPRSGRPVDSNLISASVYSTSCAYADGLATAAFALGEEGILELVESIPDTEVYLLLRSKDGAMEHKSSSGWPE